MDFLPRSPFEITPLFTAALLVAVLGSILYFIMRARVAGAGIPVKFYVSWKELRRVLRLYKELAPEKGWSLWPIAGYWVSIATLIVIGLVLAWTSRAK
jgi:hypothetical protein